MEIRQLTAEDAVLYKALRLEALQNHPEAFGSDYEAEKVDRSNSTQRVSKVNRHRRSVRFMKEKSSVSSPSSV